MTAPRLTSIGSKFVSFLVRIHTRMFYYVGKLCFYPSARSSEAGMLRPHDVQRVLIIRLDEVGDLVLTSPLFRRLRSLFPGAVISLVVKTSNVELVSHCPYLDEVLTFEQAAPRYLKPLILPVRAFRFAFKNFLQQNIDIVILPRWDTDESYATFLAFFSGAGQRIGFSEHVNQRKQLLNSGFDRMLTIAVNDIDVKHEVERGLRIAEVLGSNDGAKHLEVWPGPEDVQFVDQINAKDSQRVIGLGIGARHPKRIWPVDRFIELGKWLIDQYEAMIIVIGARGEERFGEAIASALPCRVVNMVGKTTFGQVVELLKHSVLFVGNDSAPIHLAAAAGLPIVEISCHPRTGEPLHVNSPERFGPWGVRHAVARPQYALEPCTDSCSADEAHCIASITVEEVKKAIHSLDVLR